VCVSVCCVRVCAPFHDDVLATVTLSGKGYMPLNNSRLPARVGITYKLCVYLILLHYTRMLGISSTTISYNM